MPSVSFQKQFVEAVESGEKRQTIRAMRKRPFMVGDTLHIFYAQRTKHCRKLKVAECIYAADFEIKCDPKLNDGYIQYHGYLNGQHLSGQEAHMIATMDGFSNWTEMVNWFHTNHGMPFEGQIIRW